MRVRNGDRERAARVADLGPSQPGTAISPEAPSGYLEALILNQVEASGRQAVWRERGYVIGNGFRDPVQDVIMHNQRDPAARPLRAFEIG